jgi:cytochrome c peroxidase
MLIRTLLLALGVCMSAGELRGEEAPVQPPALGPLPPLREGPDEKRAVLGKMLFFDARLSGDGKISCVTCHDPNHAWTDGLPLSEGYPGSRYFRNTPTLLNTVHGRYFYWDGRLSASDPATLVRDHISEAHFMQADGRLVIERMRQIPVYESGFKEVFGGEPTYGRILDAVSAYVRTLRSADVPFDRYVQGEEGALTPEAKRGLDLFMGKGGCVQCHNGPLFSDGSFHNLGLPVSEEIFTIPERHITFRRFFRTLGVAEYAKLREDPGRYGVTKEREDRGKFRTPTLCEVTRTPPYMHDGSLPTLEAVVDFYAGGGGTGKGKDPFLRPFDLNGEEKRELVAFLGSLSGKLPSTEPVESPPYALRTLGEND